MPPTTSDRHEITAGLLESLGRLIRTSKALQQHHSPEFGLTGTPLGILRTLAAGDARPGDVATRLQLAPSVISRAVVPLEQAQLVERRTDPADARAWRLGLTEAGHRRLAQARQELVDNLTPLLGDWEGEDLATLTELLGRFERTLAGQLADAGPRHPNLDSNEGRA